MQKLLEKAARRAERAAVMDTCPREEGDQDVGRTECVSITPTWPIHVGAWHLWWEKNNPPGSLISNIIILLLIIAVWLIIR